jgi:antitoxin component of MazEF toxin-antitoxin module
MGEGFSRGAKPMRVTKWGNSLAIRLPAAVVEVLGLKEGDEIEIHVADARQFGVASRVIGVVKAAFDPSLRFADRDF